MDLATKIKIYFARKELKIALRIPRRVSYPNMDDVKSILVLFKSEENERNDALKKIVAEMRLKGQKAYLWGYLPSRKEPDTPIRPEYRLFGQNELNHIGLPKKTLIEELRLISYDIVISLDIEESMVLDYLMLNARSRFRAGRKRETKGLSDLMIEVSDEDTSEYLMEQILKYLNSIQAKEE